MRPYTLFQFQCQVEGDLFYYQSANPVVRDLIAHCPLCGSTRMRPTGRTYPGIDQEKRTRTP